jgi:hypothetical protein
LVASFGPGYLIGNMIFIAIGCGIGCLINNIINKINKIIFPYKVDKNIWNQSLTIGGGKWDVAMDAVKEGIFSTVSTTIPAVLKFDAEYTGDSEVIKSCSLDGVWPFHAEFAPPYVIHKFKPTLQSFTGLKLPSLTVTNKSAKYENTYTT